MQHDHRHNAGGVQSLQLIAITGQFRFIQGTISGGLETGPFDAKAVAIDAKFLHPLDVFGITVIAVASGMTGAAIGSDEISPFILDVAFDLSGGGGCSPQETRWEF